MGTIIDDQSIGFYCSPLKQEIQFFERNAFINAKWVYVPRLQNLRANSHNAHTVLASDLTLGRLHRHIICYYMPMVDSEATKEDKT